MNEIKILFCNTLTDIEKRLAETDPYEILMISSLIRKLFLDDFPLVDQVNQEYHLKLTFEVTVPTPMPIIDKHVIFWNVQDGLDPDTARPSKKRITINRDQFFRTIVTVANSKQFTVREIVLYEANIMGGIHAGSPKTDKDRILQQIDSTISVGGYATSLRQLKAIARVILRTLDPLRRAINSP